MWIDRINEQLKPSVSPELAEYPVLDLFAGCGGLSLGFESQGFKTVGFEMVEDCCKTYRANLIGSCIQEKLTPDFRFTEGRIIIGGPPCQPFSVGGKQNGLEDSRDGFPIFLSAVEQLNPDYLLIENVRGMLYKNKAYLLEILNNLELQGYRLDVQLMRASDYGVPQNRERVFILGSRTGLKLPQSLSQKKITVEQALGPLITAYDENSKFLTPSMDAYVAKYERASKCARPRDLHPEKPARTLTCRNLAGSTGDMMRVKLPDGRRRRITVREAARLQSFPDWFEFEGGETSQFTQIGNAVAPWLAYQIAGQLKAEILVEKISVMNGSQLSLID